MQGICKGNLGSILRVREPAAVGIGAVVSCAGRFWPARLSLVRLGGGEWKSGMGRGNSAAGFRAGSEGVPDERSSVCGRV